MEWYGIAIILFVGLIALLIIGLPVAFSLGLASIIGIWVFIGPQGFIQLPTLAWKYGTDPGFACLPLFILMAELLGIAGVASDAFTMAHKWLSGLPGGLAISTVVTCAIFAAACGTSTGAAAAIGIIVIPELLRRGYRRDLSTGSVAAGGTLGILIPPSGIMILYALITEQSIGSLFIAGIMPGIMMVVLFSVYIAIRAKLNPQIAPSLPSVTWKERFASLRGVWAFLLVIVAVLGTIYAGVCTATEAAAVGAFASFIIALAYRKMSWAVLKEALFRTVRTSCFIFFIIFGAMTFAYLLCYLRIPMELSTLVASTGLSPIQVLIMINVLFLILGMFLDPAGILVLTLPVLFPVVQALGFNPIWFGVMMTMNMEMANITPPVGINLFVIKSISPEEVTLGEIIRGAAPFVGLLALGIALLVIFPGIALWLPGMMR